MSADLQKLIEASKLHRLTATEKEEQRQSFAYGNTNIENPRITREVIASEAKKLANTKISN